MRDISDGSGRYAAANGGKRGGGGKDGGKDRERAFWNGRAADFPRWSSVDNAYERGMLETIRRLGADFRGRTVLDVGAGSGQYTLEIAREADKVTALDISEEMLRLSRLDAESLGVSNIDYAVSDWEGYEPEEAFDVVFCMMSPAARDDPSREKLFACARETVVVTGFAKSRPAAGLADMLGRRGLRPKEMRNGPEMREFLDRTGRRYRWELKEGVWRIPYTREKYAGMLRSFLEDYGVNPDSGEVEEAAAGLDPDGAGDFVVERPYAVEVIVSPAR
ncbi:MAG: class I SAM-dependent methyltransferase [Deltaproteobacteria bacterium]|jgi:SAM-dependent methyltransferase|nr:class I SAM-dependent methyltransferase [Deltaproteobacteria bacterium]